MDGFQRGSGEDAAAMELRRKEKHNDGYASYKRIALGASVVKLRDAWSGTFCCPISASFSRHGLVKSLLFVQREKMVVNRSCVDTLESYTG